MSMTKTDNISIDELIKIGGILQQVRESEQVGIRRIQAKHNGFPKSTHWYNIKMFDGEPEPKISVSFNK